MKKLLSILGSVGMIGVAGATVVACAPKGRQQDPKVVALDHLKWVIEMAKSRANSKERIEEAATILKKAITEAEVVAKNKDATVEQLKQAATNLSDAMSDFNRADYTPIGIVKEKLEMKIDRALDLVDTSKKETKVTNALKEAINAAKKVREDNTVTEEQVNEAIANLEQAVSDFEKAPNKFI